MAVRIDIVRRTVAGGNDIVEFVPSPLEVPLNEMVFWCNLDPLEDHHIDRVADPIRRFSEQTPARTPSVLVRETMDYRCILHGEQGRITVQGMM